MLKKEAMVPFLRWAGGKRWLIKHLDEITGTFQYRNYHEPFLGGGAIFFALNHPNKAYISDLNAELVNAYLAIKENPCEVIKIMKSYKNTEDFYYFMREKICVEKSERAARFIFLNQTSFNGLYRVNQDGKYNVPYGRRNKTFLEEEKIVEISKRLSNTTISCGDFTHGKKRIKKGDLVFLDPPYTVSHNNNGFIKYNQKLFSIEDQKRLSEFIDYIKGRNAFYILTNAAHPEISKIFDKGDRQIELSRASLIAGEKEKRGHTTEFIFTNI